MKYNSQIEKSDEGFEELHTSVVRFTENNYLQAIEEEHLTPEQIRKLVLQVKGWNLVLDDEYYSLKEFIPILLSRYASNHKDKYTISEMLFSKLSKTTRSVRLTYEEFLPKYKRYRDDAGNGVNLSASQYSYIVSPVVQKPIFGLDSYPDCVKELYEELGMYFAKVDEIIRTCQWTIREIGFRRESPETILPLYDAQYTETLSNLSFLMKHRHNLRLSENEEVIKMRGMRSNPVLTAKHYLVHSSDVWFEHVMDEQIFKDLNNGFCKIESQLWPEDKMCALKTRLILFHIDELNMEGQKGKFNNYKLCAFYEWSGANNLKSFIENYFNKYYTGSLKIPVATSVYTARNHQTKGYIKEAESKAFKKNLDELVEKYDLNNLPSLE